MTRPTTWGILFNGSHLHHIPPFKKFDEVHKILIQGLRFLRTIQIFYYFTFNYYFF